MEFFLYIIVNIYRLLNYKLNRIPLLDKPLKSMPSWEIVPWTFRLAGTKFNEIQPYTHPRGGFEIL